MKEKIKKIFSNKFIWERIIVIFAIILLVSSSYFKGFIDGLLIDNELRTEVIEKINEETKKNKLDIEIDKKEVIDLPYTYNYTYQNINMPIAITSFEDENGLFFGIELLMSFDLSFDFLIYSSDNIVVNNISMINFETGEAQYSSTGNGFTLDYYIPMFSYNLPIELIKVDNELFSFDTNDNVYFSFPYFYANFANNEILFYIDFNINNNVFTSYFNPTFLYQFIDNVGLDILTYFTFVYDKNVSKPYPSYTLNSPFNSLLSNIFAQENGGASLEELEQAYQNGINVGYQSGVIEGVAEYKTSQEYKDELKEEYDKGIDDGYDIGYQARQDSVEDSEQTINSIWSILEKAITSVLNVLSFEIMPGIPLYVCIVVPILLCILLWVIKVGAS